MSMENGSPVTVYNLSFFQCTQVLTRTSNLHLAGLGQRCSLDLSPQEATKGLHYISNIQVHRSETLTGTVLQAECRMDHTAELSRCVLVLHKALLRESISKIKIICFINSSLYTHTHTLWGILASLYSKPG